jgi:DNA-binding LytR/AlgR family response regulator
MRINENVKEFVGETASEAAWNAEDGKDLLVKDAIFIRDKGHLTKVRYESILYLKGDGNYTTLVTSSKSYSLRNILKDFEEVLPSNYFLRIHKSFIVNIHEINTISSKEVTVGQEKVPVGRTYYPILINSIQKLGSSGFD